MKYRCKYEYCNRFGHPNHTYTCIGRHGAVHFHISDFGAEWEKTHGQRFGAGLEIHYREPPPHMADYAPSQDKCWLIGCPCWHDGTTMYAEETLLPMWRPNDHERMFRLMEHEYRLRFEKEDEEKAA